MLYIPSFNSTVNAVLDVVDLSSSAEVYNAHPESEEANGFDKQTGLKLASKKVLRTFLPLCRSLFCQRSD